MTKDTTLKPTLGPALTKSYIDNPSSIILRLKKCWWFCLLARCSFIEVFFFLFFFFWARNIEGSNILNYLLREKEKKYRVFTYFLNEKSLAIYFKNLNFEFHIVYVLNTYIKYYSLFDLYIYFLYIIL